MASLAEGVGPVIARSITEFFAQDRNREIIQKLQKPFNKAIDFVVKTGLKVAGPLSDPEKHGGKATALAEGP